MKDSDIKNSIIVTIEHVGLGIVYEVQYLENDKYEEFYCDYHALANHFDEDFNTDLIANLSDTNIIDMIQLDIENDEMEFYKVVNGTIV